MKSTDLGGLDEVVGDATDVDDCSRLALRLSLQDPCPLRFMVLRTCAYPEVLLGIMFGNITPDASLGDSTLL